MANLALGASVDETDARNSADPRNVLVVSRVSTSAWINIDVLLAKFAIDAGTDSTLLVVGKRVMLHKS
jgi:hypothetical protein